MIEGDDGVGKETICTALANLYRDSADALHHVAVSQVSFPMYDEPSGELIKNILTGKFGNPIKADPYFTSAIFTMDRKEYYRHYLENVLKIDHDQLRRKIIFDRGWMSSLFYQGAKVFYSELIADIQKLINAKIPYLGVAKSIDDLCGVTEITEEGFFIIPHMPKKGFGFAVIHKYSELNSANRMRFSFDLLRYEITEKRVQEVNKYADWLYTAEVSDTILKDMNCFYFYIHSDSDLSSKTTDEHEKNYWYRDLVKLFAREVQLGICDVPKCIHLGMEHINKDTEDAEDKIKAEVNRIASHIKEIVETTSYGD